MKRSWEGVVLRVMGAKDFRLEVTGREEITPDFIRVHVRDGGLLERSDLHPTMWIRLWFDDTGKGHQRAYTLVDPDPKASTFSMDFALHHGIAANWARGAQSGDTIEATVQGSAFDFAKPHPRRVWIVGDPASVPAINSLLDELRVVDSAAGRTTPVTAWLENQHDADPSLGLRTGESDVVSWIPRKRDGAALVDAACDALTADSVSVGEDYFWLACEASSTRAIARHLRKVLGVDRQRINALGYWRVT